MSHVGFTGTQRGLTEPQRLALVALLAVEAVEDGARGYLNHGDCIGADAEAHEIAAEMGYRIALYPGGPLGSPKRAGSTRDVYTIAPVKPPLERNRDIVNWSDHLIACPRSLAEQRRSGTWATVRYARRVGKPVTIVWPDGRVTREKESNDGEG